MQVEDDMSRDRRANSVFKDLQHYHCKIEDGRIKPVSLDGQNVASFRNPATQPCEKLYLIKHGHSFCYIGKTSRPIAQRMYVGFNPHTETGYHGYPWRNLERVDVFVWPTGLDKKETETVEAEVVFLVRKNTGQWPLHQTEIHFHNPVGKSKKRLRETAKSLYERLR